MAESRKRGDNRTTGKAVIGPKKEAKFKKDPKREGVPPARKKAGEGLVKVSRRFLEGVLHELKRVHWPTRREVVIYTGVVLVSVILVGIIIMVFDLIFSQILSRILT